MNWNELFISLAETIAKKSKDPSTQVGCVIVSDDNSILSMGFNGFPIGVKDYPKRYTDRELKYNMIAHAESNAIYLAARNGVSLNNSTIYMTGPPCSECMKAIIQAGIKSVFWPEDNPFECDLTTKERWQANINISLTMASEAGVRTERL